MRGGKATFTKILPEQATDRSLERQWLCLSPRATCTKDLDRRWRRVRCSRQRQEDIEDGNPFIMSRHRASMPLDNGSDNREAESASARRPARRIDFVEPVEDERQ